jgi:hypothetical protein
VLDLCKGWVLARADIPPIDTYRPGAVSGAPEQHRKDRFSLMGASDRELGLHTDNRTLALLELAMQGGAT